MSNPDTEKQTNAGSERVEPRAPEQRREWAMAHAGAGAGGSRWLAFGGWMLLLAGAFNVIAGLTALFRPDYYVVAGGELLVFGFGAWGWIWLAFGVLQVAAGAGCLGGMRWARITGIGLAGLSAIGHLAFLAAFPLWEFAAIALAVLVMYALVVPDEDAVA
ncbi:DUF7144 family membrane protein [Saccharopolyspora griseoalba]|uniref:DUF7144 domain-containing protein n=1 Tax=Saccharopolyspora griseoalba TaxID=1431848 RepID=A0ABW2LT38_9PSEU